MLIGGWQRCVQACLLTFVKYGKKQQYYLQQ